MSKTINFSKRDPAHNVNPLFAQRWSPRAFKASEIDQETQSRIFEAARWSPSCFNEQPWRFYTSTRKTFKDFAELLTESNRVWARNASVIGFISGKMQFTHNDKINPFYHFDCGAAWMAMTLQARMEGLYTHGMAGIDFNAAHQYLELGADEKIVMGFVIGKLGDAKDLTDDLRQRELPSPRKPLQEVWQQK